MACCWVDLRRGPLGRAGTLAFLAAAGLVPAALEFARDALADAGASPRARASASRASSAATIASWSVSVLARSAGVWKWPSMRVQSSPRRWSHRTATADGSAPLRVDSAISTWNCAVGGVPLREIVGVLAHARDGFAQRGDVRLLGGARGQRGDLAFDHRARGEEIERTGAAVVDRRRAGIALAPRSGVRDENARCRRALRRDPRARAR